MTNHRQSTPRADDLALAHDPSALDFAGLAGLHQRLRSRIRAAQHRVTALTGRGHYGRAACHARDLAEHLEALSNVESALSARSHQRAG